MEVKNKRLADIMPYAANAKKHDRRQINNVAESIKQYGFVQPIVIDREGVIVIGHCRAMAAKKLGMEEVPCVCVDDLTPEQVNALRLVDNKSNESDWDFDLLADELPGLDLSAFDFEWGLPETTEEVIEDEAPKVDEDAEPIAKLGDIWQLGRHRLMCGSSTDKNSILKLTENNPIYLIYTDPPYGMNAVSKSGVLSKNYKTDIIGDDDNSVAISAFKLASEMYRNTNQIWWGANYYTECLPSSECWIVWDKNNGASDQTDCELAWANFRSVVRQFTMASEKKKRVHPTQKPVKLFAEIVKKFDKNNTFKTVLDLFGGSGSTLIACEQMNRACFTMELDPRFCDVIIKRWENLTGEKAVLLNDA
uniref:Adenine specific DNA methyltransferase n=1 Tax=Siphoviridae sp. ctB9N2 TaxID=2826188 RepID=A0A8S5NFT8_9CAUD|nr:MAG TPA: adenine specific DNA methyltransferase [Siphoviridae sp. ctB9N2]